MGARLQMLTPASRRALAREGMTAAIQTRLRTGMGVNEPLCIYDVCQRLGIKVRFVDINVEGMYSRGRDPRILVAAKRPVPRRAFTCAHELGHHVFEHGSAVDELKEERSKEDSERPEEILANSFSAFMLMPTLGIRHAFASRGLDARSATPVQLFNIACNFGVGYATLVSHLAYGMNDITPARANELLKSTPKSIRVQLLGKPSDSPVVVADAQWNAKTLDLEIGSLLLVPTLTKIPDEIVEPICQVGGQMLYRATSTGIRRAHGSYGWATYIRVSRERYVGLAEYRHLENNDEDEDE